MTRERKELKKKMDDLFRQEMAEYELGCGFGIEEIADTFRLATDNLMQAWAATYGETVKEHDEYVFQKHSEAYDAGRIPYEPCYGITYM